MTTPPVADRVKLPGSATGQRCKQDRAWTAEPNPGGLAQPVGGRPSWSRPPSIGWAAALGPRWLRPSERGLAPARYPARPGPGAAPAGADPRPDRPLPPRDRRRHRDRRPRPSHRGMGLVAQSRRRLQPVPPGGEALADRVRAGLAEVTRYPAAIEVEVRDGIVTLARPVLRQEADEVRRVVADLPGVAGVEDRLEIRSRRATCRPAHARRLGGGPSRSCCSSGGHRGHGCWPVRLAAG
jgi:hypothetical protein